MRTRLMNIMCALVFLMAASCEESKTAEKKPKNIILLIGDGMGLSQVSSAFYFQEKSTNFWRFPHTGLIRTSSSIEKITDSAAGATAFSTGEKSYNGAISVDGDSSALPIITDHLSAMGRQTGVIATSSVVHATPAAFFAHVPLRRQYEDIAAQLPHSAIDFFAAGGLQFFNKRSDGANYLDSLATAGFEVDTTSLAAANSLSAEKKYGYLLAADGMPRAPERGSFLPDATTLALSYLNQHKDGFFLMVEGSQIDWGGHANDTDYVISEMLDFDRTLGVVLDFAKRNPETLVVVTADHETGGFTLSAAKAEGMSANYDSIAPTFSTGGHSATLIPVFAYGPGAATFSGVYENTDIYHKIMALATGGK